MHISLAAEKIFNIGPLFITNSMINTYAVMAILILLSISLNIKTIPGRLQSLVELIIEMILNLVESIAGHNARKIFPFVVTFFIFILSSNWLGLLPGVGTIGLKEILHGEEKFIPLFRAATADLNTTLALAVVAMIAVQIYGFKSLGISYSKKFFNFSNPIMIFVGFLELISEFSKIISFGFRLYGNIFAGEVLMGVIAFLLPVLAPTPFFFLEIFVGFIQALVFTLLLTVFLTGASTAHEEVTHGRSI